jgi:hypothetical protein
MTFLFAMIFAVIIFAADSEADRVTRHHILGAGFVAGSFAIPACAREWHDRLRRIPSLISWQSDAREEFEVKETPYGRPASGGDALCASSLSSNSSRAQWLPGNQ